MKLSVDRIKIGERSRKEFGDINALANSLSRFGLFHPIIVDKEGNLVAGHRRLLAAMDLGWDSIEANTLEESDEITRREIELEENIRRKDLVWTEEVRAVRDLYRLRQSKYGSRSGGSSSIAKDLANDGEYYGVEAAAEELDVGKNYVSFAVRLADALDEYPPIGDEKSKASAWKRYLSWKETQLRIEQARRTRSPETEDKLKDFQERADSADNSSIRRVHQAIIKAGWKGHGILYFADSRDVLQHLPSESVDCIVTDPPFALGMFKEGQTSGGTRLAQNIGTMYDDDPHETMNVLDEVFMHAARVLKPEGFVYCFFHMTRYEPMFLMLRKHFGSCDETPIIWIKNTPGIGDPGRSWVYAYEPCFYVSRGSRRLVKPQAFNYLKYDTIPPSAKIHPTEKPIQLLRHLISASCVKGEVVLDPFAGSASTLVAAVQVGCKFYGIEKHEPFYRSACERLSEAIAAPRELRPEENAYEAAANLEVSQDGN